MKNVAIIGAFTLGSLLAASCSEQTPKEFDDIKGVYFDNRTNTRVLQDSTDVTFVYQKGDELQVPVRIQLVGRPSGVERPVSIAASSENAVEGADYVLPEKAVIAAGETALDYVVTLKRTDALKRTKKCLKLELLPNSQFALPVKAEVTTAGDTVTALTYRILFSDMFTSAPKAWEKGLLGTFTQQKFELICRVLDIDPADFNDDSKMTLAMQSFVCSEMTVYVKQQKEQKDKGQAYDADAFDDKGIPLSFVE